MKILFGSTDHRKKWFNILQVTIVLFDDIFTWHLVCVWRRYW